MGKKFYISDLHFGHSNVLKLDNRPFTDIQKMEDAIIENWNKTVTNEDLVYILGDFCWKTDIEWERLLKMMNGEKVLILGNHDVKRMSSRIKKRFQDIKEYKEIEDNGRKIILCHYPIPFYRADYDANTYMLYGHLHNTLEEQFMQKIKQFIKDNDDREKSADKCNFYNCWCGFYDYTPVTLDQIIEKWKNK